MKLRSKETDLLMTVGTVVEYLPGRAGKRIAWVKINDLDPKQGMVQLVSPLLSHPAWYDPADIGAHFVQAQRPRGQTKKHAQDLANKAADARENSLAGGRCSSTGLSGDARRVIEDLKARTLTPTGRQPTEPQVQDLPHEDIHKRTAAEMFGVAGEDVTPAQRMAAKQRNFWDMYSVPASTLQPIAQFPAGALKPADMVLVAAVAGPEFDAIVAGLRLLAREVAAGNVVYPHDESDIGDIWTNAGEHEGLPAEDIHKLADRLLGN